MRVICVLLALYAMGTLALEDYWYGINLGFKDITVARIGPEYEVLPITKIEGSEEYRAHIKKLARNSQRRAAGELEPRSSCPVEGVPAPEEDYVYCAELERDQGILNATLSQVLDASAQVGHPMNISGITFPTTIDFIEANHLRETFVKSPLAAGIKEGVMVRTARYGARVAYGLDRITGGRFREIHDDPIIRELVPWSSIIFIDYGIGYLNFTVAEIEDSYFEVIHEAGWQLTWSETVDIDGPMVYGALKGFFFEFSKHEIAEGLVDIVVQGEASPKAMEALGYDLRWLLPSKWEGLVRDQIDPNFVAAAGGALYNRLALEEPRCTCCYTGMEMDFDEVGDGNNEHLEL